MPLLENEHIILRAPEPEDLDLLYQWENNTEIWQVSNTLTPFSRHLLKKYLKTAHRDIFETRQLRLMISQKKPVATIGTIDLFDYDPLNQRAGIGILIGNPNERNKGHASSSLNLLIDYTFDVLHMHQVYCHIMASNKKSIELFKKHGFEYRGSKKEWVRSPEGWIDELFFQKINPHH